MTTAEVRPDQKEYAVGPNTEQEREKIPDEEMANLLAAIGNSEAKAVTLLAMKPGLIYSTPGLHKAFVEMQGENPEWVPNGKTPFDWCESSLAPIGLVAFEIVDRWKNTYGYEITDYGAEIGQPLAALLLDFSKNHPNHSLFRLFGSTQSKAQAVEISGVDFKKRSPQTRLQIYRQLLKSRLPLRYTDLNRQLGFTEPGVLNEHLFELNYSGIIYYNSVRRESGIMFRLRPDRPSDEPSCYRTYTTSTTGVFEILNRDPETFLTTTEITRRLVESSKNKSKTLRSVVTRILMHLRKTGYVEVQKFDHYHYSEINLHPDQHEHLTALIGIIEKFQKQDSNVIEKGRRLASYFRAHPEEIADLIEKARENSPNANRISLLEMTNQVYNLIADSPGCTTGDLQRLVVSTYKRRSSRPGTRYVVNKLREENRIEGTRDESSVNIRWKAKA